MTKQNKQQTKAQLQIHAIYEIVSVHFHVLILLFLSTFTDVVVSPAQASEHLRKPETETVGTVSARESCARKHVNEKRAHHSAAQEQKNNGNER